MALKQLDFLNVDYPNPTNMKPYGVDDLIPLPPSRNVGFYEGDITNISSNNSTEFLVVSTLPKDYNACSNSIIGQLKVKGLDISTLTAVKDFRPEMPCWIATIPSKLKGLDYKYVLVFEPDLGSAIPIDVSAPHQVDLIFRAIHCFKGDKAANTSVSIPMVSCGDKTRGSAGADPSVVLRMLFHSAVKWSSLFAFNIDDIKLVIHKPSVKLASEFASMKSVYNNLPYATLPNLTPKQAAGWPVTYSNYALKSWTFANKSPNMVWPNPITNYQVFGIRMYTTPYFHVMNDTLRKTDSYGLTDINNSEFIKVLPLYAVTSAGLMNLPKGPKQTYRGLNKDSNGNFWNPFAVGSTIKILSYLSSAAPKGHIFDTDDAQITINNYNAKDISSYSKNPHENEHLYDYNFDELVLTNKLNSVTHQIEITVNEVNPNYCS